ncbi:MAG: Ribosome maturation factor RimM [Fimbriimonadaceae bacterium]|nr:Ribosome maturation factor RimM [Fimbriimonadaceae bacterium]
MPKKTSADDRVQIGQVVGVFGLKGHVKVKILTEFTERFEPGQKLWIDGHEREILDAKWHRDQARIALAGISTPELAESLRWKYLEVPKSERPNLEEDEYYVDDLIGFEAFDASGKPLGKVNDVIAAPAHDILDIGGVLVPAVEEFVVEIDLDNERVVIQPIPGLFDDDSVEAR